MNRGAKNGIENQKFDTSVNLSLALDAKSKLIPSVCHFQSYITVETLNYW